MMKAEDIEDVKPSYYKIDREIPDNLEKAVLSMGCFWGVEALFGGLKGVHRTKVGYTGGDKEQPTYHSLGNHTETVMVGFDPNEISYRKLLEIFFENHNHQRENKPQYASRIFYLNQEQKQIAKEEKTEGSKTSIEQKQTFWLAEDYHQKYRLRRTRKAEKILEHYSNEEFINSTLATKLNAEIAGKLRKEPEIPSELR